RELRKLAQNILINTYNPWNQTLTSYSLNAVSAIIWDYRGIDTVFETMVLFAAVVGVSLLFRDVHKEKVKNRVMPFTIKISTQLIVLVTIVIALSLAVHGHLTPGGGFQAGAVIATAIALSIIVFSLDVLHRIGLSTKFLLGIRLVSLLLILFTALLPLFTLLITNTWAYIMQNQVKTDSQFSMPNMFLNTPLAGSIFLFNLFEFAAVATAFSYVLILFVMYREKRHAIDKLKEDIN
ncbi:MAG: MnhB domain-containing protein, partial [Ignisphaera sp.]